LQNTLQPGAELHPGGPAPPKTGGCKTNPDMA